MTKYKNFYMTNGGYVTIAYTDEEYYGYAFCSPEDEFDEEYGKDLAASRLGRNMVGCSASLPLYLKVLLEMLYWAEYPESAKHEFTKLVGTQLVYTADGAPAHMEIMKPKFYV